MKMMLTSAKLTRKKKKVSFHALIKLNTEQRRPMSNLALSGIFSILIYENRLFAYSSMRIVMHTKKNRVRFALIANRPDFQFEA